MDTEAEIRGICPWCSCMVVAGKDCHIGTDGSYSHMRCHMSQIDRQDAALWRQHKRTRGPAPYATGLIALLMAYGAGMATGVFLARWW